MSTLLAVDPGIRNPALALFVDGHLTWASRVKLDPEWTKLDIGERCRLIGRRLHQALQNHQVDVSELVMEKPQVYRTSRSKGDPNDLLPLMGVGMALAGRLDVPVTTFTPAQWIGQTPKAETGDPLVSPRGRLIWRCLDATEQGAVVVSHDALDAVGLGLKHLKRLQRRVYPGAS